MIGNNRHVPTSIVPWAGNVNQKRIGRLQMNVSSRIIFAIALAAIAALGALYWPLVSGPMREPVSGVQGRADIGGPFSLIDHHGAQVAEKDFIGRPMLIAFGYTSCPDVCQMMVQNISEGLDQMGEQSSDIGTLFVSFDTARDTVPVMAEYLSNFHPAIRGLTGSPEAIADIAKAYHVFYEFVAGPDPGETLVNHSSYIFLMDRNGEYADHFGHHVEPEKLARAAREAVEQ